MNAPEILRAAAEKIAGGWCKNSYERDGKVCTLGAMFDVQYRNAWAFGRRLPFLNELDPSMQEACRALSQVIKEQCGVPVIECPRGDQVAHITYANDYYARDVSEIVACMEKAAVNLEGEVS